MSLGDCVIFVNEWLQNDSDKRYPKMIFDIIAKGDTNTVVMAFILCQMVMSGKLRGNLMEIKALDLMKLLVTLPQLFTGEELYLQMHGLSYVNPIVLNILKKYGNRPDTRYFHGGSVPRGHQISRL